MKLIEADSPILAKVREGFGGRLKFILTGSAPMSPHYLSILKKVFKCDLVEGYGQTENTAAAFLQNLSTTEYGNLGYVSVLLPSYSQTSSSSLWTCPK